MLRVGHVRDWAAEHPELAALAGLLAVGAILRIYFLVQYRPTLVGYSDSGIYFMDANIGVFSDPFHVVGYGMFLEWLHWIWPHLILVTVVQHGSGSSPRCCCSRSSAGAAGRSASAWCLPRSCASAATSSSGSTPRSRRRSSPFFVVIALYGAIRAWHGSLWWGVPRGRGHRVVRHGAGRRDDPRPARHRVAVFAPGLPSVRWLASAGLALALSVGVIGGYIVWRHADTGLNGLTTNGDWNLYGRVAPFADCNKFTPPAGTEGLCESKPPSERIGRTPQGPGPGPGGERLTGQNYIYGTFSPAQRLFGPPFNVSPVPGADEKLRKWSLRGDQRSAARLSANAVWNDSIRVVLPDHRSLGELSADENIAYLTGGPDMHTGVDQFVRSWQLRLYPHDHEYHGTIAYLRDYEALTRLDGVWMLLLLGFALAAPFAVPRRVRAGAILLTLSSFTLIWFPILTKSYDFRMVVPTSVRSPRQPRSAGGGASGWSRPAGAAGDRGGPAWMPESDINHRATSRPRAIITWFYWGPRGCGRAADARGAGHVGHGPRFFLAKPIERPRHEGGERHGHAPSRDAPQPCLAGPRRRRARPRALRRRAHGRGQAPARCGSPSTEDGGVDLDAITAVTQAVSPVLDDRAARSPASYLLEVSSPGLERALRTPATSPAPSAKPSRSSSAPRPGRGACTACSSTSDDDGCTSTSTTARAARSRYADITQARTVFEWGPQPRPAEAEERAKRAGRRERRGDRMKNPEMLEALSALAIEKGISEEIMLEALANALVTAYKRMPDAAEEALVEIDVETGEIRVIAQELDEEGNVTREWDDTPADFGRIAAQTAKQVILQRIREAEREMKYEEYAGREGDIVTGIIQQTDARYTLLDLGRVEALLPAGRAGPRRPLRPRRRA